MSADNYIKHIAEATYKNTVKNKSHTDNNLAWYEEPETVTPRVDAKAIWLDAEHIPEDPEKVSFRGNIYFKTINGSSVGIVEKFENVATSKVNERAVFYSPSLVDCIQNENYHLTIKDAAGDVVPFGLKKWTIDTGVGYLSFTDGMPSGYELPFYVTGYRYCGRKLPEHMITTDGSQQMLPDYVPTEDQSVATKSYVDSEIGKLDNNVEKMLPPKPDTFSGKDIEFICDDKFDGYDITTMEHYDNIVLPHYKWTMIIPEFYNPGYGRVSLLVNTADTWQEFAYIELGNVGKSVAQGLIIDYDGDAYANSLASRGFFNSMKVHFDGCFDDLSGIFKSHTAPMRFMARYQYFDTMYYSNELVVCEEPEPEEMNHLDGKSFILSSTNMNYRRVSGIITPTAESVINVRGVTYNTLKKYYRSDDQLLYKLENPSQNAESEVTVQPPYTKYSPVLELNQDCSILYGVYSEDFKLKMSTYDIFGNKNGELENTYNFRIDTISDESNRVKSGTENAEKKRIDYACYEWDPTEDLRENNELQLLGGVYRWPEINHSVNGNGNLANGTWADISWLRTGLDYSKCAKSGVRYVTLKYDMSIANGVYINVLGSENLTQDKETHAYQFDSMYIKVDKQTDWLDAKEPYDGIGQNTEWMQGCLAVQDSEDGKIYCTFGPKPLEGTLYVRIGIRYDSHTTFKGLSIKENI